ncbi:MAG: hypothetical protein ACRDV3_16640, partial [Acidothermaceae bacterium]
FALVALLAAIVGLLACAMSESAERRAALDRELEQARSDYAIDAEIGALTNVTDAIPSPR